MRTTMLAVALVLRLYGVAAADAPPKRSVDMRIHTRSYVATKSAQVFAAFLVFHEARRVDEKQCGLAMARERDALLVPGGASSVDAGAMGAVMMGAAIVFAAHAPGRLRALVDGPVHFGPAMFESGGLGAGVGGRF
jgi:hypothetical protein